MLHKKILKNAKKFCTFSVKKHLTFAFLRGRMLSKEKDCDEDGTAKGLSESRRVVRADGILPSYPSLPSRRSEPRPGSSVSRGKGNGLIEPE